MDITIAEIQRVLPHRPPFLFIDRVRDIVPAESGTGLKLITANDPFLTGNGFVFPNCFFIEIMAQTCAMICAAAASDQSQLGQGYLAGFDLECTGHAQPGDVLEAHVTIIKIWGTLILASGTITIADREIGRGRFTIGLTEPLGL